MPPGTGHPGGSRGRLSDGFLDVLVHGQDIAVPHRRDRTTPLEAARAGTARVWVMGWPFWAKRMLRGYRLTTTDIDWAAASSGADVRGSVGVLLLLTGRTAALP